MNNVASYTIHIGSARLLITASAPPASYHNCTFEGSTTISRAKLLKKVETYKYVAIFTPDPAATIEELKLLFRHVRAAGGAVLNDANELLMIRLRERWDLPKGHIEAEETSCEAARREVFEETGIVANIVGISPIATTWHAYDTYGDWELKSTDWWQMQSSGGELSAQHAEGITSAVWVAPNLINEHLKESYDTIKEVVAALGGKR